MSRLLDRDSFPGEPGEGSLDNFRSAATSSMSWLVARLPLLLFAVISRESHWSATPFEIAGASASTFESSLLLVSIEAGTGDCSPATFVSEI